METGLEASGGVNLHNVRQIAETVTESTVCGLARAGLADIDRAAEAIRKAKRGRIHTFISTSPQHRDFILKLSQDEVLEAVVQSVTRARAR